MIPRKSGFNQRYLPESYRTFRSPTNPCGGGGGTPYPPYHLFFRRGSPPHPCAGPSGGHPLSTHGPDRLHSSLPGLWHDRTFTTEIPCGQSSVSRARTTRIPHIAVGGWGSPPSPSIRLAGGYPLPPFGPVRPATMNQKPPQVKPLHRSFHTNNPVFPVQKRQACRIRWWGGWPPPPPPLSGHVGGTHPGMILDGLGVPSPPQAG